MKQNPVYNREMRVSSRSLKLPLIIFLFNGILFLVTLLNMYSVIMQVKATANIQYSSFMDLYEFVTSMEFLLLMFIVPAVTASSISGERERQTLDLMLTTRMSAGHRRREAVECFKHTAFAHPFQFPGCCNGIRIRGYHMGRCFLTDPLLCDSGIFCRKHRHLFFSSP